MSLILEDLEARFIAADKHLADVIMGDFAPGTEGVVAKLRDTAAAHTVIAELYAEARPLVVMHHLLWSALSKAADAVREEVLSLTQRADRLDSQGGAS
jgi:hypothetical protein